MSHEARGFLASLAASAAGAALSGAAAAVALSRYPPGSEGLNPAFWVLAVLPVAAALVCAGALAKSMKAVALNSAAFLLPQAATLFGVFFFFAHPGGLGGEGLVLATAEFWLQLAGGYALVVTLVGVSSLAFRIARR